MNTSTENVTIRRRQRSSSLSNNSIVTASQSMFETTIRSLPDTSIQSQSINEKVFQITQLKEELQIANQEIDNLNYENKILKTELDKCKKLIEVYKKVGLSESPILRRPSIRTSTTNLEKSYSINMSTPKLPNRISKNKTNPRKNTPLSITSPEQSKTADCGEEKGINAHKEQPHKSGTEINNTLNESGKNKETSQIKRKKVLIMADHQGKMVQNHLQRLLGDDYHVTCTWKQGARLYDVLNSFRSEILTLSKDDYVVVAGGTNDVNPRDFQFNTMKWLESVPNANVIITEIPYNRFLNVKKLNYELKFICNKYSNVQYLELDYEEHLPRGIHFSLNLCRSWLREILRKDYESKFIAYNNIRITETPKHMVSTATQTVNSCIHKQEQHQSTQNTINTLTESSSISPKHNKLFRD